MEPDPAGANSIGAPARSNFGGLQKAADKYLIPTFGEALAIGLTARYTDVVDMAKKSPALFIPVKVA